MLSFVSSFSFIIITLSPFDISKSFSMIRYFLSCPLSSSINIYFKIDSIINDFSNYSLRFDNVFAVQYFVLPILVFIRIFIHYPINVPYYFNILALLYIIYCYSHLAKSWFDYRVKIDEPYLIVHAHMALLYSFVI